MKKPIVVLLILLLTIIPYLFASCAKPDPLDNTGWYVVKVYGEEIHRDIYISYSFYNGEFSGHDGCNRFSGKYSVEEPDILKFGEIAMTTQGCEYPEDVTAQRREISGARSKTVHFQISGSTLTFYDKDRQETLTFNRRQVHLMDPFDLIGTKWKLESINDVPVPDSLSITLSFDSDSEASGRAGNYTYRLMDYQARGDIIGWGIRTQRDGEPLPGHERYTLEYLDAIGAGTHQYNQQETSLEIFTQKGETLVYRPLNVAPMNNAGGIDVNHVSVLRHSVRFGGTSTLPDGAVLVSRLYEEDASVAWWPKEQEIIVENGKWDMIAVKDDGITGSDSDLERGPTYRFMIWERGNPEVESVFFFDMAGPPSK